MIDVNYSAGRRQFLLPVLNVAVATQNIALQMAARALDMRGEVIVPSFTFIGTVHALQWQEVTLSSVTTILAPTTSTRNGWRGSRRAQAASSGYTSGGGPVRSRRSGPSPAEKGLRLLYDATHALGCAPDERMIGSFGDAEVFSFHATKFLNVFEGGGLRDERRYGWRESTPDKKTSVSPAKMRSSISAATAR